MSYQLLPVRILFPLLYPQKINLFWCPDPLLWSAVRRPLDWLVGQSVPNYILGISRASLGSTPAAFRLPLVPSKGSETDSPKHKTRHIR